MESGFNPESNSAFQAPDWPKTGQEGKAQAGVRPFGGRGGMVGTVAQ